MDSRSASNTSFMFRATGAAEQMFLTYAKANGIKTERYGFDHTPLPHFKTLPQFVRNTPDYVATRGKDDEGFLVECKAGGNGQHVNIKDVDWSSLALWSNFTGGNLYVFFNDSKNKKVALVKFRELVDVMINTPDEVVAGVWQSDGVTYKGFPKRFFDWTPYRAFGA